MRTALIELPRIVRAPADGVNPIMDRSPSKPDLTALASETHAKAVDWCTRLKFLHGWNFIPPFEGVSS
jgi:hypothetical protein